LMARGASVYEGEEKTIWRELADALAEHGIITIDAEY